MLNAMFLIVAHASLNNNLLFRFKGLELLYYIYVQLSFFFLLIQVSSVLLFLYKYDLT